MEGCPSVASNRGDENPLDGDATAERIAAEEISMAHAWTRMTVTTALVAGGLGLWSVRAEVDVVRAQARTPVTLTHVFTGADGLSHVEVQTIALTPRGDAELSEMARVSGLQFRRQAPTYVEDYHPASRKQYVITLRGEGEVELPDGQKIVGRAGDVWLMEDVTGKGHISRGRGTADRITLFIPVAD
jgi:hypothetical protein